MKSPIVAIWGPRGAVKAALWPIPETLQVGRDANNDMRITASDEDKVTLIVGLTTEQAKTLAHQILTELGEM